MFVAIFYFWLAIFEGNLQKEIELFNQLPTRFSSKISVDKNGCWRWQAHITKFGYGFYSVKHKLIYAHRFCWSFFNGEITENFYVLHKCDVRDCVNPHHLFLGTLSDNMFDMYQKGRHKGHFNQNHKTNQKYSPEIIQEIKDKWATGKYTQPQLCKEYGIKSQGNLSLILSGKRYGK